jgi:hypothetical protein
VQDEGVKRVLLVLPLIACAACSGGSSSSSGASKVDYLRKAEAICTKANADQKALKTPTSAAQLSPYVDAVVQIADTSTTALAALTPPKADAAALQSHVLGPLTAQLAKAKTYATEVRKASDAHDQLGLAKLLSDPPNKTAADLDWMRKYGFQQCVDAADTSS